MIKTMTDTPQTRNDAPLPVAPAVPTTSHSFPTSEAQLEIWLHSQLCKEANCAFNETATLELQGVVDEQALKAALRETVARHEMLRATFSHDGRTVLLSDAGAYEYCVIDWSNCSNEEADERHRATICEIGSTPFDLEQGPLLRVRLTRMSRGCSYLTITAHHIVLDGWSVFVFCRDLGQLYDQHRGLPASELPAPDRYSAYAQAMHAYEASEIGQRDASYWRQRFEGEIPVLDLPTDRPRPSIKTFASQRVDYCIAADKVARIRKSAAKLGCSLFNYVLVGFQAYLARVTHQQDFSIGVPTAGQAAMGFQNLIGHCVNTVPFRAKVELEKTVQEYVKESRSGLLDALEHQRYTFGRLVRDVAPARDPKPTADLLGDDEYRSGA